MQLLRYREILCIYGGADVSRALGLQPGSHEFFRVQLPKCHPSWNPDKGPMKTSPFPIHFLAPKWEFACVQRTWSFMFSIFLTVFQGPSIGAEH